MYILLPIIAVSSIVILIIIGFAVARHRSVMLATRVERIFSLLPLLDCGACGYETCHQFARAVLKGDTQAQRCFPAGPKNIHAVGDEVGVTVEMPDPVMAVVHCKAGTAEAVDRAIYDGPHDCMAADQSGNGHKQCRYACLGLGNCVRACPFDAIRVNDNKVAVVNPEKCNGCGLCVASCPRMLISMIPTLHKIFLACANHDDGSSVRRYCTVGCTACGLCVQAAPPGAISMEQNLPQLDYTAGEIFVAAANRCPSKCFTDLMKARPKANIDIKCDGCGDCVSICPVNAIVGQHGERHVVEKSFCIGCGKCVAVCHVRSISMWGGLGYMRKESVRKDW